MFQPADGARFKRLLRNRAGANPIKHSQTCNKLYSRQFQFDLNAK